MIRTVVAAIRVNGTAILIGAGGGAAFSLLNLPLAWMLGAMCATTAAAVAGIKLDVARPLRGLFICVLGVMVGSAFRPEMLEQLDKWLAGAAVLALFLAVSTALVFLFLNRVARLDPATAYFSSTPGGFSEMVLVGESLGADVRVISLVHATRVLIVVFVVPFWYRFASGTFPTTPPTGAILALGGPDALMLVACAVLGWPLAALARLPAAALVGPMVLSAAIHLGGLTASRPPSELVAVAQVVVGASVGARFIGIEWATIARIPLYGAASTAILLITALTFTGVFGGLAGVHPAALNLSLAPGGLAEMSLIALALGVDTAFVSSMHILRIGLIVLCAPLAFRLLRWATAGPLGVGGTDDAPVEHRERQRPGRHPDQ